MQTHTQSEFIKLVYITDEVPATLAPVQLLLLFPEFDDILDNGIDEEIVSKKLKQSQNFMAFFVRTQCVSTQNSFVSLTLFFFSFALSDSKFTIQSGIRMEQITHDFTIVGLCDTTLALHAQHEIRMESYIGFTMITRFFV